MANPTLVILTDRNDLDDRLFSTFAACADLLRQNPVQAENREHLKELLSVASGGVVFATNQIYCFSGWSILIKLKTRGAGILPASSSSAFAYPTIGFTGTPESTDKNTFAVFGDYIDIYDIQRAVEDGATVRIYYEGRLAKLELEESEKPKIDTQFEEITEGEELTAKEKLKSRCARLDALVGAEKRLTLVAKDLVEHFERR